MALPASWPDALDRLARSLGGGERGRREAEEWLREAVDAHYGVASLHDLDRAQRLTAFQKTCGVVLAGEEAGWPDEVVDGETGDLTLWYRDGSISPYDGEPLRRERLARIFGRYFAGVVLEGPPWRISPLEDDRPSYDDWAATAAFA